MSDKYASDDPLPGGVEQYFDTLIVLLRHVGEKAVDHESIMDFIFQTIPETRGSTAVGGISVLLPAWDFGRLRRARSAADAGGK